MSTDAFVIVLRLQAVCTTTIVLTIHFVGVIAFHYEGSAQRKRLTRMDLVAPLLLLAFDTQKRLGNGGPFRSVCCWQLRRV